MVEKRKSPRFMLGTEIRWKRATGDYDQAEPLLSRTRDLSTGGICLDLHPGVATGDTLQLEIRLSDDRIIYSSGRVAWVNTRARIKGWSISACEAGIEFLNLSEAEKALIDNFISNSFEA